MADPSVSEQIEALAADIGENIYIDVAKWHLFLADAHLHQTLAEQFYPLLQQGALNIEQVDKVLSEISVSLGGGKREVPLIDLLPSQCQKALVEILADFQRRFGELGYPS